MFSISTKRRPEHRNSALKNRSLSPVKCNDSCRALTACGRVGRRSASVPVGTRRRGLQPGLESQVCLRPCRAVTPAGTASGLRPAPALPTQRLPALLPGKAPAPAVSHRPGHWKSAGDGSCGHRGDAGPAATWHQV